MSPSAGAEASIGRYLAAQRRLRGLSLDDLVTLTKIPRRSLERLEAGAFDRVSDGFVRGFVRTVALALGLDPVETVNRILAEPIPEEDAGRRRRLQRRLVWAGAAAALVVAALFGVRALSGRDREEVRTEAPGVVVRRDAVRALAEEGRSPGAEAEQLPSGNGGGED